MSWIHTEDEFAGRPIEEALCVSNLAATEMARRTRKQREALWLVQGLGLTQKEAGIILGVTQPAVSYRLKAARDCG
jgi:DNA-directed RNA polymerase specialized sigma24 family protein